jgi:hypothetical protein
MGCDFYTFYKICIEYSKNEKIKIEDHILDETRERHYFNECERDEDFEEVNDYYERQIEERRQQIDSLLENYKITQIYKDKTWLCIPSAQEKYQNILKKYGIAEKDVIKIWKQGDFMMR